MCPQRSEGINKIPEVLFNSGYVLFNLLGTYICLYFGHLKEKFILGSYKINIGVLKKWMVYSEVIAM